MSWFGLDCATTPQKTSNSTSTRPSRSNWSTRFPRYAHATVRLRSSGSTRPSSFDPGIVAGSRKGFDGFNAQHGTNGFVLDMLFRTATFRRTKDFTPPSTVLEGSWPVCSKCLRGRRIWQYLGHAIVLAGIGLIIAILIAIQISTIRPTAAAGVGPLSRVVRPCGLMVAVLVYPHSGVLVLFRPITEHTAVTINAHPKFADAGESRGTPMEIREW